MGRRLLVRREHSRAELRAKLGAKGFDTKVIDAVVGELLRQGWQDDHRFAELLVRSRAARGYGPRRIGLELQQHGISGDAAAHDSDLDWDERLQWVYAKKYGMAPLPDSPSERMSRERFLLRRGFEPERVRTFFRRLERPNAPDSGPFQQDIEDHDQRGTA